MSRRYALLFATLLVALLLWFLRRAPTAPASVSSPATAPVSSSPAAVVAAPPAPKVAPAPEAPEVIATALKLNAADGTLSDDLQMLAALFADWRTLFPGAGNPWGENVEITTQFTAPNIRNVQFLPKTHPAINAAGELCDRWGTPFVFHALSGTRMEIRSAGLDKKFGTADDGTLTPP